MHRRRFLAATSALAAAAMSRGSGASTAINPAGLSVAAVGDCIMSRRISNLKDPKLLQLVEVLRAADCSYGNCEMVISDREEGYPTAQGGGFTVVADAQIAEELGWMGFKVMSTAHNHSVDFGPEGIKDTKRNLRRSGISAAGTGMNLQEAAAPCYFDSPSGRVALISCASSFTTGASAVYARGDYPGTPGLNPIRLDTAYQLDKQDLEQMRRIATNLAPALGRTAENSDPNKVSFLGNTFVSGPSADVSNSVKPADLARVISAISIARRHANVVLVSIHAHQNYRDSDTPDKFMQPFARACIDAGADAFIGTGSHVTWGIELYKNRPICYSLGDFIFQLATFERSSADVYESYGLDPQAPDEGLLADRVPATELWWSSVVPVMTFTESGVKDIVLHPVTEGMKLPRPNRGTPVLADGEEAHQIIDRVARLSKPYGTTINFKKGRGVVSL